MARMHKLASVSPPYELVPNIYNIHSITFLLYTLKIVILRLIMILSRLSKSTRPFILP